MRFAERRLTGIPGRPPALLDPPTGLPVPRRCPLAFDKCAEEPPFVEVAPGHLVACWKAVRLMLELDRGHEGLPSRRVRRRSSCTAVRDVSFEVGPGEVVSLIGESGSGKTHDRPDDPAARRRPTDGHDHVRRRRT